MNQFNFLDGYTRYVTCMPIIAFRDGDTENITQGSLHFKCELYLTLNELFTQNESLSSKIQIVPTEAIFWRGELVPSKFQAVSFNFQG